MLKWEYSETELWRYSNDDVAIYHVFSVINAENTVLVFSEERYGKGHDSESPHSIVMKYSADGGKSFSENVYVLASEQKRCLCNPSPVYDNVSKRLFLFYAENIRNVKTKNYYIFSDDLGITWSNPTEITSLFSSPFNLPGPGHGLCLTLGDHKGRLMIQFWHRSHGPEAPEKERGYCASFLYSDDHGESWKLHSYVGHHFMVNECRLSETKSSIVWTFRTKDQLPAAMRSYDGGNSWSVIESISVSPAINCDIGAIGVQVDNKKGFEDMMLLSRPSDPTHRRDMEILISYNGGITFPEVFRMMPGDVIPGYSDLCAIEKDKSVIGLLHCRNNHVLFSRISLETLTGGKYDGTKRRIWPC